MCKLFGRKTKDNKPLLSEEDGWRFISDHPQQHYFYKSRSLCGKYKEIPEDSHHDNNPLVHCEKCEQTIRKLMAISSSIVGHSLSARQVFNLLDNFDKIKLNKGVTSKETYGEGIVAVVTSQASGEKRTIEAKKRKSKFGK